MCLPFIGGALVTSIASIEGASTVHWWGSGDEAIGVFWDIPEFGVIPLGVVSFLVRGS